MGFRLAYYCDFYAEALRCTGDQLSDEAKAWSSTIDAGARMLFAHFVVAKMSYRMWHLHHFRFYKVNVFGVRTERELLELIEEHVSEIERDFFMLRTL